MYRSLLQELVAMENVDFIFEEATGLGPTFAQALSTALAVSVHYLDVDPATDERSSYGLPASTGEPYMIGNPPDAAFASWQILQAHAEREEIWVSRITEQRFNSALMICGLAHGLSLPFRLQSKGFVVKAITYSRGIR
jgi:hypothetical protein